MTPTPGLDTLPLIRADGRLLRLDPALLLGAGGEARVFALSDDERRVAKVYHRPTEERARKIARMIADPPLLTSGDGVRLAWPEEVLRDPAGRVAGFVMPRAEGPRIFEFYNPVTRRAQSPLFHYGLLHRAGAHLSAAFAALHARGYVVGDVNESNILVAPDGRVSLVDTDSFQVPDAATVLRSGVGRPEFTPPELQGVSFTDVDRAPEHDRFGLGVLIFLLLMEGTHPFAVRAEEGAEPLPVEDRIRAGMFPHAKPAPGRPRSLPPRLAPPFDVLHPTIRELFLRCFVDGHDDPTARPTAFQWRAVLAMAELEMERCGENGQHRHGRHLDACPWCERAALLRGRDPFPASVAVARAVRPARVPVAPRMAPQPPPMPAMPPAAPPAPRPRPIAAYYANQPLSVRAVVGLKQSVNDPVVWFAPLLVSAMLSSGLLALLWFGLAAAALHFAGKPRALRRVWPQLIATALLLVAALLVAVTAVSASASAGSSFSWTAPLEEPPVKWSDVLDADRNADDAPPRLLNPDEVAGVMRAEYGSRMLDEKERKARVWIWIEADGTANVPSSTVYDTQNDREARQALRVVRVARFAPARRNGKPVAALIEIPMPYLPR